MTRNELLALCKEGRKKLSKACVPKDEQQIALSIDDLEEALKDGQISCEDCKHFIEPNEDGFGICMRIMHGCQSWGFCADAERKTE